MARALAFISIMALDQMGFSGADVARTLKLAPSAVSELISSELNDPALKNDVNMCLIAVKILG